MSEASATGFRLSGTWRQQFDWAVVEWSRDNRFEHPWFRCLPDGDLSRVRLSYEEKRHNCIALDSDLYATVDWPYLRVWTENESGGESFYRVSLREHATPVEGTYACATAVMTLQGTVTPGDYVELACLSEHYTHQAVSGETLEDIVAALRTAINEANHRIRASADGATITLYYTGFSSTVENSKTGANGNRLGVYGNVSGARTEYWAESWQRFTGGTSPTKWRIVLDFGNLRDEYGMLVPTTQVRKMRWTYAADLQGGAYVRSEFQVSVTNWQVSGEGLVYEVAGPGSQRIEDTDARVTYAGTWTKELGNYSGGAIHQTISPGAAAYVEYEAVTPHQLYIGTRRTATAGPLEVLVDGTVRVARSLALAGEDILVRVPVGSFGVGKHQVEVRRGSGGGELFFDFIELAVPSAELPVVPPDDRTTLATDWDTDHSLAIAPERTAWMLKSLGFVGRANHYVGALVFYELAAVGGQYAQASVEFFGAPVFSAITELRIGIGGVEISIPHLNLIGDTKESIALAFALELNSGYTALWAEQTGAKLTIWSRRLGAAGNQISIAVSPSEAGGPFWGEIAGRIDPGGGKSYLDGGMDPAWRTDLAAVPRLNRAVRDWTRSYFAALKGYGIEATAAFSMELQDGDPSEEVGIAQRYPSGAPVLLNTPAIQTNFGPASTAFWRQVYLEMAGLMDEASMPVYLQFGEVQWWYFPDESGLPYYDAHTRLSFQIAHGRPLPVFTHTGLNPDDFPEETAHLHALISAFTEEVMSFVRGSYPGAKFEVLFPLDVNEPRWSLAVNYAAEAWTPAKLENLKTENFTYTYGRDLNKAKASVLYPLSRGFPRGRASHLVGVGDYTSPWNREIQITKGEGLESAVIWALDQFCLIGYPTPLESGRGASRFQG
jgi:hypothetical protein